MTKPQLIFVNYGVVMFLMIPLSTTQGKDLKQIALSQFGHGLVMVFSQNLGTQFAHDLRSRFRVIIFWGISWLWFPHYNMTSQLDNVC
jgi:hypothetical protein